MKRYLYIFIIALMGLVMVACGNHEQSVINDYEQLVERVEKDGDKFTQSDWEKFNADCSRLEQEMDKCEFTTEQKREIGRLSGRMVAAVARHGASAVKSALDDAAAALDGFQEGLLNSITGDESE